jgi:hypothetical protein
MLFCRLIRPETCPRNGKRLESCECIQDRNRRSGLTTWDKVRMNVTNLKIDSEYRHTYFTFIIFHTQGCVGKLHAKLDVRKIASFTQLAAEDFTFAKSTGDLIPFGTSGDCYSSSMNCPQGRFSIDLRRTKLTVNSLTTWVNQGHKPTMQISKAAVSS